MESKKLLVYGAVALLGLYLFDRSRKMRLVSNLKDGANTPFVQEIVDDKYANCKKEWAEKIGSRAKFISSKAKDKSESNYVASCLKNK